MASPLAAEEEAGHLLQMEMEVAAEEEELQPRGSEGDQAAVAEEERRLSWA